MHVLNATCTEVRPKVKFPVRCAVQLIGAGDAGHKRPHFECVSVSVCNIRWALSAVNWWAAHEYHAQLSVYFLTSWQTGRLWHNLILIWRLFFPAARGQHCDGWAGDPGDPEERKIFVKRTRWTMFCGVGVHLSQVVTLASRK